MADRFGWIGTSRRAVLIESLARELAGWTDAWAIGTRTWSVSLDPPDDAAPMVLASCGAALGVAVSAPLASFLTSVNSDERASSLAKHVEAQALHALHSRLGDTASSVRLDQPVASLPGTLVRPELGAIRASAVGGACRLDLWVARALVDRWAPAAALRTESLVTRQSALGHAAVRLRTELDLGTIALADIRHLRPGDVIATTTPLEAHFEVVEQEKSRAMFTASLGAREGRRAVRIIEPRG